MFCVSVNDYYMLIEDKQGQMGLYGRTEGDDGLMAGVKLDQ